MSKKVLFTGGNSSIGYTTAKLFKERGYEVTISGRDCDRVAKAAKELQVEGVVADMAQLDDLNILANRFNDSGLMCW